MRSKLCKPNALGGLVLALLCGCQSTYPYNYGSYPGVYTTPPQGYVPQSGPHVSPGMPVQPGTPLQPGTPVQPGGPSLGQPAPLNDTAPRWEQPQSSHPRSGNAFEANKNGGDFSIEKRVPNYDDPNEVEGSSRGAAPHDGDVDPPFGLGPSGMTEPELNGGSQIRTVAAVSEPGGPGPDQFQAPAPFEPESDARPAIVEADASAPNPYDYDRKGYRWLRGKVNYDGESKAWHIVYSVKPEDDDRYGGELQLVPHPKLSILKNGDVVLVEGRVDAAARDSQTGKPSYRIDHLFGPLVPKK